MATKRMRDFYFEKGGYWYSNADGGDNHCSFYGEPQYPVWKARKDKWKKTVASYKSKGWKTVPRNTAENVDVKSYTAAIKKYNAHTKKVLGNKKVPDAWTQSSGKTSKMTSYFLMNEDKDVNSMGPPQPLGPIMRGDFTLPFINDSEQILLQKGNDVVEIATWHGDDDESSVYISPVYVMRFKIAPKVKKSKPKTRKTTRKKKAKKKTGRKAPTISATKRKVGTRMRGNDGKMWQVKKSGKSQRWMAGAESFSAPEHAYAMAYNDGHRDGRNKIGYDPSVVKLDRQIFRDAYKMRAESFESVTDEWIINRKRSNPLSIHYVPQKKSAEEGDSDEDYDETVDYDPHEGEPYCESCEYHKDPEDLHVFTFPSGQMDFWCTDCIINHPDFAFLIDEMDPDLNEDEVAERIVAAVSSKWDNPFTNFGADEDWDPTGAETKDMLDKCDNERSFLIDILSDRQLDEFLEFEEDSYSAEDECDECGEMHDDTEGCSWQKCLDCGTEIGEKRPGCQAHYEICAVCCNCCCNVCGDYLPSTPGANQFNSCMCDHQAAETKLGKDSCCCGATKTNPCACMIQGVMNCNATCPCSLEKKNAEHSTWKCVICGHKSTGYGHNPEPVASFQSGRCCDTCNATVVIPARLRGSFRADYDINLTDPYGNSWKGNLKEKKEAEEGSSCPVCGTYTEVIREYFDDDTSWVDLVVCDNCYWMEELDGNEDEYEEYMEEMLALQDEEPDADLLEKPNVEVDTSWDWSDGVGPPPSQQTLDITYDAEAQHSSKHDWVGGEVQIYRYDQDAAGYPTIGIPDPRGRREWLCIKCGAEALSEDAPPTGPCQPPEPEPKITGICPHCKEEVDHVGTAQVFYCPACHEDLGPSDIRGDDEPADWAKDAGLLEAENQSCRVCGETGHNKRTCPNKNREECWSCGWDHNTDKADMLSCSKGYDHVVCSDKECKAAHNRHCGTCWDCGTTLVECVGCKHEDPTGDYMRCPQCAERGGEDDPYLGWFCCSECWDENTRTMTELSAEGDEQECNWEGSACLWLEDPKAVLKIWPGEEHPACITCAVEAGLIPCDSCGNPCKDTMGQADELGIIEDVLWCQSCQRFQGIPWSDFGFGAESFSAECVSCTTPEGYWRGWPLCSQSGKSLCVGCCDCNDCRNKWNQLEYGETDAGPYPSYSHERKSAEGDELSDEEKQEGWNQFQEEAASIEDPNLEQIKTLADKYLLDVIDDETPEFFVDPGLEDYYQFILTDPTYPEGGEPEDEEAAAMFEELKHVRYWATILTDQHIEQADTAAKAMMAAGIMGQDKELFDQGMLGLETNNQVQRERELIAQWLAEGGVHEN